LADFISYFFMICILSCSYLFLNAVLSSKGVGRKFFWEKGQRKDQETAPISFPPFYQWWVRGRTGYAPRVHLKRTLHQKPM